MFSDIPEENIVRCANPAFAPVEIFKKFDGNIVYISVCGDKDKGRYKSSKYFDAYPCIDGKPLPFDKVQGKLKPTSATKGYYVVAPMMNDGLSGTEVREKLADGSMEEFKKLYGKANDAILSLIVDRLKNES
jgi:hypothetical protein